MKRDVGENNGILNKQILLYICITICVQFFLQITEFHHFLFL